MDDQTAGSSMDVDSGAATSLATVPQRPRSPPQRASSEPLRIPQYTVGYVYSSEMMIHYSTHGHPEQAERILRVLQAIEDAGLTLRMKHIPIRPVRRDEAILIHSREHYNKVMLIQYMTEQNIIESEAYYESLSLYVMPGTTRAARLSCGGVIEACLAVARNELKKTFAIVRPPGHHAEPEEHMGFCFFNNVAIAAKVTQLLTPIKKILILDWDVHHGNGTQRAFNDDPSVLYISLHRYEGGQFYPCGRFGSMESCGEGPGLGYSVNIPWPEKGMTDADYIHAFQQIVMPIAMEFAPELVIISAGFDAAEGDDLGECHVSPTGYAHMTHMLSGLAEGKLVVALEGGYSLDAISKSALAVTRVLLGEAPPELPPQTAGEAATETVWYVALEQSKYWKSVSPKACEPRDDLTPVTFSIPEILKAHRQHDLYTRHDMLQVPLMNKSFEERYGTQVLCTNDVLDNKTMVVLAHEFGNLRIELDSKPMCDVRLEHSYLVDFSKELVGWVKSEGYALLDVNLFARPFAQPLPRSKSKEEFTRNLMTYLWDNYIQLAEAKRIVLIGHGPGCQHLVDLFHSRPTNIVRRVTAVVQVVGLMPLPLVRRDPDELSTWYKKNCLTIAPSSHPAFGSDGKILKRHGQVMKLDEPKPIKLMIQALPFIQDFVRKRIDELS